MACKMKLIFLIFNEALLGYRPWQCINHCKAIEDNKYLTKEEALLPLSKSAGSKTIQSVYVQLYYESSL